MDDTLLALRAQKISFENALLTLKEFAIVSNLQVNENKSKVIPINMKEDVRGSLQQLAQYEWISQNHFNYIGVDIYLKAPFADTTSLPTFERALIKAERIMYERNLPPPHSILGRVLVLKSLVLSRFLYPLLLAASPPPQLLKTVDVECCNYLWSWGMHHILAAPLRAPLTEGGVICIVSHCKMKA